MSLDKILEKIAISKKLKSKVAIEDGARQLAAYAISNKKYREAETSYKLNPKNNHPPDFNMIDKETFKNLMNLKRPLHSSRRIGVDFFKEVERSDQIQNNIEKGRHPTYLPKKDTLQGHIKNVKRKKLIGKGVKGLLIASGLAGAAYGGKKLYDKVTEKTAFTPNPGILSKIKDVAKNNAVPALENLGQGISNFASKIRFR